MIGKASKPAVEALPSDLLEVERHAGSSAADRPMSVPWWHGAAGYQVYLPSFADGNGDGLGDLLGVHEHLDYLAWLGIDLVWLTPFYASPLADHGYDVADHCQVDARFGSLEVFDALIAKAHRLGLRVLVDLVANHTSWRHPWFVAGCSCTPTRPSCSDATSRDDRSSHRKAGSSWACIGVTTGGRLSPTRRGGRGDRAPGRAARRCPVRRRRQPRQRRGRG